MYIIHMCDLNAVDTPHDRTYHGMGDSILQRVTLVPSASLANRLEIEMNSLQGRIHHPVFTKDLFCHDAKN